MKYSYLIIVLLLSGCGFSGGSIPADHYYRLPEVATVAPVKSVMVKSVQADGMYNERALLFVEKNKPLELQRYNYHFWAQTPARMLQTYLQTCLGGVEAGSAAANQSNIQLSPVIESFERILENNQAQVVVRLRMNQRSYTQTVTAESMDMHATIAAYGFAMQKICAAVAQDLSSDSSAH